MFSNLIKISAVSEFRIIFSSKDCSRVEGAIQLLSFGIKAFNFVSTGIEKQSQIPEFVDIPTFSYKFYGHRIRVCNCEWRLRFDGVSVSN